MWARKKQSQIQIQKKRYIQNKNKIQQIIFFLKIRKKKQFKKRSMVGYFKVRRKNFKIQSKSNLWARKKNLKYKFKRKDIYIRKKNPIYYLSAKNQKKILKRSKVKKF